MKPFLFYIGGLGMVGVALVAAFTIQAFFGASAFQFLALGALAWIVSVGLKFAWAIPTNKHVIRFFEQKLPPKLSGYVMWSYVGLLTGVFECGIALLFVLNISLLHSAVWREALAFGVGFGAVEALLLGFFSLFTVFKMGHKGKKKAAAESFVILLSAAAATIIERTFTLFVHAFTKVLIVLAVQQNNYALFWLSFGFKSLLDGIAAFGHLKWKVLDKLSRIWIMELVVVVFGVISLLGLWILRAAYWLG